MHHVATGSHAYRYTMAWPVRVTGCEYKAEMISIRLPHCLGSSLSTTQNFFLRRNDRSQYKTNIRVCHLHRCRSAHTLRAIRAPWSVYPRAVSRVWSGGSHYHCRLFSMFRSALVNFLVDSRVLRSPACYDLQPAMELRMMLTI